jgi:hypothetical protein
MAGKQPVLERDLAGRTEKGVAEIGRLSGAFHRRDFRVCQRNIVWLFGYDSGRSR